MSRLPSCQAGGWMTGKIMRNMMITSVSERWRFLTVELKTASPELLWDENNHMSDFTRSELSVLFPLGESHDCSGAMWHKIILTMSAVWFPQTETEQEDWASYITVKQAAPLCAVIWHLRQNKRHFSLYFRRWMDNIFHVAVQMCTVALRGQNRTTFQERWENPKSIATVLCHFLFYCVIIGLSTYYFKCVFKGLTENLKFDS